MTADESCVFCALIATGEARWVTQTPYAVAFAPLPEGELAPGHTLVVPREHCVGVLDAPPDALAATMALVQQVSQAMTQALFATGVVVLNASGPHSGQSVDHLHVHVVPCWPDDGADFWPTDRSTHPPVAGAYEQLADAMRPPHDAPPADVVQVRAATAADVAAIADLAQRRRLAYEVAQPGFWRVAADARAIHEPHLAALVADPSVVSLVAHEGERVLGYLFATVVGAPPVYDPGGPSGYVDDFAVVSDAHWDTVGRDLLERARVELADRGAAQIVVVTGHHDRPKLHALEASGLSPASEWWVGDLRPRA